MGSKTWKWERLLVKTYEYTQDRLHNEIAQLKAHIKKLEEDSREHKNMTLMAEVLLCLMSFAVGIAVAQAFV